MPEDDNSFGDAVKRFRIKAGLSKQQAAANAGIELSMWLDIENGIACPKLPFLWPLSRALGVKVKDLIG